MQIMIQYVTQIMTQNVTQIMTQHVTHYTYQGSERVTWFNKWLLDSVIVGALADEAAAK